MFVETARRKPGVSRADLTELAPEFSQKVVTFCSTYHLTMKISSYIFKTRGRYWLFCETSLLSFFFFYSLVLCKIYDVFLYEEFINLGDPK